MIRDQFRGEPVKGKTLSAAVGVAQAEAHRALAVAFETYRKTRKILPLLISLRFVKATPALLGLTIHAPVTCVLEIDSINTAATRAYLDRLWCALAQAGVRFTVHWGKMNHCLDGPRVRAMYGDRFDRWLAARRTLLGDPQLGAVFGSPFAARAGVSWVDVEA